MILVDTSAWIDFLSTKRRQTFRDEDLVQFVTCPPVVQEVLQGLRPGLESDAFREAFLALPIVCDPMPLDLYVSAADLYRQGRRRGLTIRSSVDCLIAAIALKRRLPIWHRDRDFDTIARFTPLEVVRL